jgi:CRP/FNR family transcriptional regulator, anaerobic regulatory protein
MPAQTVPVSTERAGTDAWLAAKVLAFRDVNAHCPSCTVRNLCMPIGLGVDAMNRLDQLIVNHLRVRKRGTIYRPGDAFGALYAVRLGTFKILMLAEDGREQVTGFHMAGEILGHDGIASGSHVCQAIALEDSEVCVLPFRQLDELASDVPALRRNMYRFISRDICQDQNMMLLLGSRCAEERLVIFLLDLARRYQERGYSSSEFMLRMTREDIASFVGLKLETISRLFSHLQGEGMIQVQGRAIKLLDVPALKERLGQHA